MRRAIFIKAIVLIFGFSISSRAQQIQAVSKSTKKMESIYQFKVKDINGQDFDLAKLQGKKVMIVNTASECGLTPQYAELEKIYQQYKDKGFVIVGFPANNFGEQEPGTNVEIATFCSKNYGVTFPMMEKISVDGKDMHPLYQYLTSRSKNGFQDAPVGWNFQKFLINRQGQIVKVVAPKVLPNDEEITSWLEQD